MKTTNNEGSCAGPKSELCVSLLLNTNSSCGQSTLSLVQEALELHRETCLSAFFSDLRTGDYKNAYIWHKSVTDINDVLCQLLRETAKLASNNHYAEEFRANPGGYTSWKKNLPEDKRSRYDAFLKLVTPDSDATSESANHTVS